MLKCLNLKNVTTSMSGNAAKSEGKVIFTRPAATHSIGFDKNGDAKFMDSETAVVALTSNNSFFAQIEKQGEDRIWLLSYNNLVLIENLFTDNQSEINLSHDVANNLN